MQHHSSSTKKKVLQFLQKYRILSPEILSQEFSFQIKDAQRVIDLLLIENFIEESVSPTGIIRSDDSPAEAIHSCKDGCKGCPFSGIAGCVSDGSRKAYILTDKAKKFIQN